MEKENVRTKIEIGQKYRDENDIFYQYKNDN